MTQSVSASSMQCTLDEKACNFILLKNPNSLRWGKDINMIKQCDKCCVECDEEWDRE